VVKIERAQLRKRVSQNGQCCLGNLKVWKGILRESAGSHQVLDESRSNEDGEASGGGLDWRYPLDVVNMPPSSFCLFLAKFGTDSHRVARESSRLTDRSGGSRSSQWMTDGLDS
jgi:hypothetical protein